MNSFTESQRFNQKWLWFVLVLSSSLPVIIEALTYDKNSSLPFAAGVSIFMFLFTVLLLRMFRLTSTIDEEGVSYRLFPLHTRPIKHRWADIERAYIRQYRPIGEYGGWGLRYSFKKGTAVNISGDMGLQLVMKDGKRILLGTQQPDALRQTLDLLVHNGTISSEMIAVPEFF